MHVESQVGSEEEGNVEIGKSCDVVQDQDKSHGDSSNVVGSDSTTRRRRRRQQQTRLPKKKRNKIPRALAPMPTSPKPQLPSQDSYIHGAPVRSGIVHGLCTSDLVEGFEGSKSIAEDINTTTTTTKRKRRQDNDNDDDTARRATFNAGHVDAKNLSTEVPQTSPNSLIRAQLPLSRPLPSVIGTGQAVCQLPEHCTAFVDAADTGSSDPQPPHGPILKTRPVMHLGAKEKRQNKSRSRGTLSSPRALRGMPAPHGRHTV